MSEKLKIEKDPDLNTYCGCEYCCTLMPFWYWKKEEDPHYFEKVKKLREATDRSYQHCNWMLQICYGRTKVAHELLERSSSKGAMFA